MNSEILAKVIRGETIESVHRGHLIILDGTGETIAQLGNPEIVTFIRSSAKSFQTIPFLTSGAADRFNFTEREVALACASHSGETIHVEIAAGMLEKINLDETDLQCGAHPPFNDDRADEMIRANEKPTQLHNNCSGKHAAMLAFAKHINANLDDYLALESPVQQKILETFSLFSETPAGEIKIGVDGCAAPNFAVPLKAMAKSFVNLINPPRNFDENLKKACRRIVAATINYPELIGGTERLDTMLMQTAKGKIISKVGAEGVWLCGILPSERWKNGLGIALKIEDGDDKRARPVIAIEILRRLGVFAGSELEEFSPLAIKNRRGDSVGRVEASFNFL